MKWYNYKLIKINIINSIDKTKPRWYYIVNPKENKISNQKRFNIRYDQKNKNDKEEPKKFSKKI